MAQSAAQKRIPLDIEPFWDKPSVDPPLKWEKWQMQAKLALLAKENITIDTLLEPKPETVQLPLEPIYEVTITGSSAQSDRERLARNSQSKMKAVYAVFCPSVLLWKLWKILPLSMADDSASPGTQNIFKRTHKRDGYDTGTNCEQWMAT